MKNFFKQLKHYPIVIIFMCFLAFYTILDCCINDQKFDEYENRSLAQIPAFSWKSLAANEWTQKYETYIQDQFVFRHNWIVLKSIAESAIQKTENNNVIYGKDGYQFYKFTALNQAASGDVTQLEQNADYVARFAARHPDKVTVMIAPSAANILQEKLPAGVPLLDENPWMDSLYQKLGSVADICDVRDSFRENKDEYLYYRTDHHWTTGGAYLAYCDFIQSVGKTPFDTSAYKALDIHDFTGTNYNKSLKFNTEADVLTYYELPYTLTVKEFLADGSEYSATPGELYDYSKLNTRDKYAMFLRGNNGYSTINGDGEGRILVIKDSYANCFVPFLTANYAQIDVVDLRYWKYNVENLIQQFDYDDILMLYNFQTFSSETTLFYLNAMVSE